MRTPNVIASAELRYILVILWATSVSAFCHMLQIYPWTLIRRQHGRKYMTIKQQSNVLFLERKDSIVFRFDVSYGLIIDSLASLI
jgi:hypothetical protein